MRTMLAAIGIFVVCQVAFLLLGLQVVNSPLLYGSWPSGVTETGLRSAVSSQFASCARVSDGQPRGCPQSTSTIGGPVSWTLAGDPLHHAGFEMIGRSGDTRTFQVWGSFAMLASGGGAVAPSAGPFIASVTWNGHALVPGDIRRGGFTIDRPPEATDAAARRAAAAGFAHCSSSPDQAHCVETGGDPTAFKPQASWTASAPVSYDPASGVVHVHGQASTSSFTAGYDASEVVDAGGQLVCYQIAYTPI